MRDLNTLEFHPTSEKVVDVICKKTQNNNQEFFRILVSYYFAKVAATMRVKIATNDRGEIPVNLYALNLAPSGNDKGHSTNILEEHLLAPFKEHFFDNTVPLLEEISLAELAVKKATIEDIEEVEALEAIQKEYALQGELLFSFDSASGGPAIKQLRQKLLMLKAGAINLEIDEIGSNLIGNSEALNTFLELFDVGKLKQKLIKNTKENTRSKEIDGRTPTNLMMFGTPDKLFDASKVEDEFYSFLETGYARRFLYGFTADSKQKHTNTPEEVYEMLTDPAVNQAIKDLSIQIGQLAHISNHGKVITVSRKVSILIIEYRMYCENLAVEMKEHEGIAKAEMAHRYFKAMKLAGAYAFIDGHVEITEENFYHAVCMVEESGNAFKKIMNRDRAYVKLAKYVGTIDYPVTHVDLSVDLPFYNISASKKQEMLQMAAAWGYKNDIIIKRSMESGIEFITGETLQRVDLDNLQLSYSHSISDGYKNVNVAWEDICTLTQEEHKHWINHHSKTGHRSEEDLVQGFDMVVLDVDGTAELAECFTLLQDYRFLVYITKRHTAQAHRFRIIMPMNYHLKLNEADYRMFMKNIYEWIPFEVDISTTDRCRKWLTHKGNYEYSKGEEIIDARLFIPKTAKNDEQKAFIATYQSMNNMERWFLKNSSHGNRNNQLSRYAFMLVDLGYDLASVRDAVLNMNSRLSDKLPEKEIEGTIIKSAANAIAKSGK